MTAVSLKPSVKTAEVLTDAVRARISSAATTKAAEETKSAAPTGNAFYKVMFDESLDPDAKKEAIKSLLVFAGTKEESRARIKEYMAFEEYMQSVRERMATEIIKLQDTETFAVLQSVMNSLNGQLVDFERQMQPLTDITDAIYTLRTNDATLDVFNEINDDKAREEAKKAKLAAFEERFEVVRHKIQAVQDENARLGEEKGLFGFGAVTKAARQQMAVNEEALRRSTEELSTIQADMAAAEKEETESGGKFSKEKQKLRELLDLTSDQHKDRQKALVESALHFVESAKREIGEVKMHLEGMNKQVENLLDNNTKMTGAYAIMSEGIEDAQKENMDRRKVLEAAPEGERAIQKMQREDTRSSMDDHIRMLDNSARLTTSAVSDLTSQTIRVKGMKDANESTLETTRTLHTQGVAGIADRLSSTLQAVSSAALGESSAAAKDTLRKMAESTDKVSQRESIRVAMGLKETNRDLLTALESLGAYGEVQRAANEITRAGLADIRANLEKIKAKAAETQGELHESYAAAAQATAPQDASKSPKGADPFKI